MFAAAPLILCAAKPAIGADIDAIRKKAEACAACHGADGNSSNPVIPSLAGQPKQFITTQLVMFREGNRKDPQTSPLTANMSNADINDFGTYFSAQELTPAQQMTVPDKAAAGRGLTEQFNCVQCHGPALTGQQHIPRLAGQQGEYLRIQLRGFKSSTRFDMDGNMTSAAQPLSGADIDTLADYLAGLR
ncbi:MAG: c-type cytochrome [Pseudomonadota bacterium]|nr:c-type cytochrome [Pseudomonadota bacterium]